MEQSSSPRLNNNTERRALFFFRGAVTVRALVAGVALGVAFVVPETWGSLLLGGVAALGMLTASRSERPGRELYVTGVISHLIAFPWLIQTIELFGGFPRVISVLLFLLFCVLSTLSFALAGWLVVRLRRTVLEHYGLSFAASWFVVETLVPKLFPWQLAYTQIRWSAFAVLAESVGAVILSAFLLWLGELALTAFRKKGRLGSGDWGSVTLCLLALLYGAVRVQAIEGIISNSPKVVVGVVQGNLGVFEKRDIDAFAENLAQYRTLSQQAVQAGAELLLWPESVVNRPVLESSPRFSGTELCPLGADGELKTPLLYGGLSVRKRSPDELEKLRATAPATPSPYKLFNTAFGVDAECAVVGRYHKRILMPFGEYMPFASLFPQVKALSPQTGEFDFGDLTQPIVFEMSDRRVKATTLICYEDLVPALSQRGTAKERGNLLVNLTNDAWYGETAAPYQHHLLALWRAIETRRFLIRATNTGYTAVVDPLGRTVTSLPIFQAGYFVHPVGLIDDVTVFARWGGRLQRLLLQIIALTVVFSWKRRQRAP